MKKFYCLFSIRHKNSRRYQVVYAEDIAKARELMRKAYGSIGALYGEDDWPIVKRDCPILAEYTPMENEIRQDGAL